MAGSRRAAGRPSLLPGVARLVVVVALVLDAVVHLRLASGYQQASPGGIGAGNLFRIESAAALLAAAYVLVRGTRAAYVVAFGVAFSAVVAVLLYRYVEVPQLGPVPAMYEPIWFFEKTLSAVAEGMGALAAALGAAVAGPRRRREAEISP